MQFSSVQKSVLFALFRLVGVAGAVGIIWCLVRRIPATQWHELVSKLNVFFCVTAFAVYGMAQVISARRWGLLQRVHEIQMSKRALFQWTLVGVFFSFLMPGATSGDLLRLAYVAKTNPGKGPAGFVALLMDRVTGVIGLLMGATCAAVVLCVTKPQLVAQTPILQTIIVLVVVTTVGLQMGLMLLVFHARLMRLPGVTASVHWLARKLPARLVGLVERLSNAAGAYQGHLGTLYAAIAMSMAIHILLGCILCLLGRAAGEMCVSANDYCLSVQLGNALTVVPVTPGGIGVRDGSVRYLLGLLSDGDMEDVMAALLPLMYSIVCAVWAVIGGLVFACIRQNAPSNDVPKGETV